MTIERPDQDVPTHLEAINASGYGTGIPPTDSAFKDYGPASDTPTSTGYGTQAERDLAAGGAEIITEGQSLSPLQASLRRLGRDRRAMISLGVVLFVIVFSYLFPLAYTHYGPTIMGGLSGTTPLSPAQYHSYIYQDFAYASKSPSFADFWTHPLGTDSLGRDMLARLMAGVNTSIQVALAVEVFDISLGLTIGTLAGYFGGFIDYALARFTDVMFAFPGLLLIILAAASLAGPNGIATQKFGTIGRLLVVVVVLGLTIWPQMARFVRGQTLQLKEQQFIEASRTVGGNNRHIIIGHIVPNLFSIVITAATLNLVGTIGAEAVLSFLGLGVNPPGSSLGLMIAYGFPQITLYSYQTVFPSVLLILLVLCFAFFGDGVRDAFDPRTKD
jgi:oligopeptide transport system permease protein